MNEESLRLSLSTASTSQQPPPPQSPPHPPLLQPMPPSSSSSPLFHRPPRPPSDLPFLLPTPSSSLQLHQELPLHYSSQSEQAHTPLPSPPKRRCYASSQPPEQQSHAPPEATPSSPSEGQASPSGARRCRKKYKETSIEPPYPWAKSRRAKVLSMEELLSQNITVISGDVRCKVCEEKYEVEYDLQTKFSEVASFIAETEEKMHDRAPKKWCNPEELDCKLCGSSKCVEPLISKKKSTNWLFLFLGQMIGYCNIVHLRYFCKYANLHRGGAKNRLLYSTYMDLHRQLYSNT